MPPGDSKLYVRGNKIMRGGEEFILKGTSLFEMGADDSAEYVSLFLRDYPQTNTIRFPMTPYHPIHPGGWIGFRGGLRSYFDKWVKPQIIKMHAEGIYTILDWHVIQSWSGQFGPCEAFWRELLPMLNGVGNKDMYIFEIFNEPKDAREDQMRGFYAGCSRVLQAIRGMGWDNLVIFPSPNWCKMVRWWPGVMAGDYAEKNNVALCYHLYNYNRLNWGVEQYTPEALALAPIVVTEVGWDAETNPQTDPGHYGTNDDFGVWVRPHLDAMKHLTAWCQHHNSKPPLYNDNRTLNAFGQWMQEYLS